jgi:mercuric ion transport protein
MIGRVTGLAGTAIGAATASALCCAGPLLGAVVGASGLALAAAVGPFRPVFMGVAGVALVGGFWLARREDQKACQPGVVCASPEARRRTRLMLGISAGVTLLLASYPVWRKWL